MSHAALPTAPSGTAFGMSSAHGFGRIGETISPIGLALIVGSSNILKPDVTITAMVPCFLLLGAWPALAGLA